MASRRCDHCGATVAADEQFCPNCGSFIDPLEPGRGRDNVISVNSDGNYEEFELGAPPPSSERPHPTSSSAGEITCPSCGAVNPSNNRHCQECGARLSQGPLPTAPRPAVQATAGVRAALAISALLFGVVVIALLFNVFNGDPEASATSSTVGNSTTTAPIQELAPIDVLDVECSQEGIGSFVCDNLISNTDAEYQFTYEDVPDGEPITIRLIFNQAMVVQRIDWVNLEDATRLKRNYRAQGIVINAQTSLQPVLFQLEDLAGSQPIAYAALDTQWVEITIESAYQAEVVDGNSFRELAIQEIRVIGRPGTATNGTTGATATTLPGSTTTVPATSTTAAP